MKKKKTYIYSLVFILGLFVFAINGLSQQSPLYSQYMFNKFLINPAVAGSEGYTAFNLTAREQWVGLKDAPFTHAVSGQLRVSPRSWLGRLHSVRSGRSRASRMSNVGLGGYIFNDRRGPIDQTGMQLTYAYHIPLDEAQLSFGLSASVVQYSINKSKLDLFHQDDYLIDNSDLKRITPDFNFGAYYTAYDWYAGFSVNQILQSSLKFGGTALTQPAQRRIYYLIGGYRFALNREFSIEPSTLFKTTEQANYQADLALRLYYENYYWGGLAYRTGGWIILTAGMRYDKFYFGYSCDLNFNSIQSHSYGSHELMVAYKFGMNVRQYKWLERY